MGFNILRTEYGWAEFYYIGKALLTSLRLVNKLSFVVSEAPFTRDSLVTGSGLVCSVYIVLNNYVSAFTQRYHVSILVNRE